MPSDAVAEVARLRQRDVAAWAGRAGTPDRGQRPAPAYTITPDGMLERSHGRRQP
jgi:hypothetical protein